jgi:hypothetical protein
MHVYQIRFAALLELERQFGHFTRARSPLSRTKPAPQLAGRIAKERHDRFASIL